MRVSVASKVSKGKDVLSPSIGKGFLNFQINQNLMLLYFMKVKR